MYLKFIIIWLINSLIIWAANALYAGHIVIGTLNMSPMAAVLVSGFFVTVLCKLAKVLFVKFVHLKKTSRWAMFIFYWVINSIVIWLVARLAPITGLGISSFYWAFGLGFALNFFQWVTRQILKVFKATAYK